MEFFLRYSMIYNGMRRTGNVLYIYPQMLAHDVCFLSFNARAHSVAIHQLKK